MFAFEKLEVWHLAVEFCDDVYRFTRTFPSDERFGLTSQLRRAAVSIAANMAEDSGRSSKKEFVRFVEIAYGFRRGSRDRTHDCKAAGIAVGK
jgi:four helix bundle protein